MAEKPFVVTDRRRFTAEGDVRPDAPPVTPGPVRDESSAQHAREKEPTGPKLVAESAPESEQLQASEDPNSQLPPPLTEAQLAEATAAYNSTIERLDVVLRANNPGMEPIPQMSFERFVQSLYMQAIMQLGGATEPGQEPKIDFLGARQSIDLLVIIEEKSRGNLNDAEKQLVEAALFEMRMGFLEITQHLAQQAQRAAQKGQPVPPPPGGPSIVR